MIAGVNLGSFLTPDMASKNDARHGIGLFSAGITWHQVHIIYHSSDLSDAMSGIAF